jgi:hypothetical protein
MELIVFLQKQTIGKCLNIRVVAGQCAFMALDTILLYAPFGDKVHVHSKLIPLPIAMVPSLQMMPCDWKNWLGRGGYRNIILRFAAFCTLMPGRDRHCIAKSTGMLACGTPCTILAMLTQLL